MKYIILQLVEEKCNVENSWGGSWKGKVGWRQFLKCCGPDMLSVLFFLFFFSVPRNWTHCWLCYPDKLMHVEKIFCKLERYLPITNKCFVVFCLWLWIQIWEMCISALQVLSHGTWVNKGHFNDHFLLSKDLS